ncbi:MAG: hypothetical protein AB7E47_03900 [Desulfovibrionaceae bacterium]
MLVVMGALVFGMAAGAWAADQAAKPAGGDKAAQARIPDKPAPPKADRSTPVTVEQRGTDDVGARLVFHVKELFNKNTLFSLSAKDGKKLKLIVSTSEEFPDRPALGSVYAAVWVYSESESTLKYYLDSRVGVVDAPDAARVAEVLAATTDTVASKYAYLFE